MVGAAIANQTAFRGVRTLSAAQYAVKAKIAL